jgi:hypothetical protein
VTDSTGHLPYWTLEQLAEDDLPHRERTLAEAHLRSCAACGSELEQARALLAALAGLPALAPSASFADRVMARVQVAPAAAEAMAAAPVRRRWLPVTVRGWMGLTAVLALVIAPLAGLGAWLAANPMVSTGSIWQVARGWLMDVAWSWIVSAAGALGQSGAFAWAADLVAALPGPAAMGVPVLVVLGGAAIPAAAYMMARLLRTPATGMTHAY